MRNLILVAVLALGAARPVAATTTHTQGEEAGYAIAAASLNMVYLPAKTLVAVGGLMVGAVTGLFAGGNTRAAYAIWVPAASGTFLLTPGNIDGSRPIEFFGSDYADRPSRNISVDRTEVYDAIYLP